MTPVCGGCKVIAWSSNMWMTLASQPSPNQEIIDKVIQDLLEWNLNSLLKVSFQEYLGIKVSKIPDGRLEMTQSGLIQKIFKATGMEDCNPNWTPAPQAALGSWWSIHDWWLVLLIYCGLALVSFNLHSAWHCICSQPSSKVLKCTKTKPPCNGS